MWVFWGGFFRWVYQKNPVGFWVCTRVSEPCHWRINRTVCETVHYPQYVWPTLLVRLWHRELRARRQTNNIYVVNFTLPFILMQKCFVLTWQILTNSNFTAIMQLHIFYRMIHQVWFYRRWTNQFFTVLGQSYEHTRLQRCCSIVT